jgi:hypothetical protein
MSTRTTVLDLLGGLLVGLIRDGEISVIPQSGSRSLSSKLLVCSVVFCDSITPGEQVNRKGWGPANRTAYKSW